MNIKFPSVCCALIFAVAAFLLCARAVYAVSDGQGNEVFPHGSFGIGTTTPQGAFVVTSGNVGIGTWAPVYALDVQGSIRVTGALTAAAGTSINGWVHQAGVEYPFLSTDNVGIGTSTPQVKLSVLGGVGIGTWTVSPGTALSVMGGCVGIGTSAPETTLSVNGILTIDASNNQTANPPTTVSTNGWKLCFSATQCIGWHQGLEEVIKLGSNDWLSLFGGTTYPSSSGATPTTPDPNAIIAFAAAGTGTSYIKGNLGIGTWITGANNFAVVGNVGIGTSATSAYVNNGAPAGGLIVEGNVGIGTIAPQTPLSVLGNVGIGTWASISDALIIKGSNIGIGTITPQGSLILTNGNLGIGTWAPNANVIIRNGNIGIGTAVANRARIEITTTTNDTNGKATIWLENNNTAATLSLQSMAAGSHRFELDSDTNGASLFFKDATAATIPLSINGRDAVGVGTWVSPNILGINAGLYGAGGIGIGTVAHSAYIYTGSTYGGMILEGNVGIGTITTKNQLDVRGAFAAGAYGGVTAGPANAFVVSGNMGIATNSPQTSLAVLGNVGIGTWTAGAGGLIVRGGNVGIGTVTPQSLVSIVGGNVGIGTWTAAYLLELGADSAAKPGGGSWTSASDARLKKDVVPITGALEKFMRMKGVRFQWINPSVHGGVADSGGFLAQDLQRVFPEFVSQAPCRGDDCALTRGQPVENITLPFAFYAHVVEVIKELDKEHARLLVQVEQLEKQLHNE